MERGADPEKILSLDGVEVTPSQRASHITESRDRDAMVSILEGRFAEVALFLFVQTVEKIDTGGSYDMEWMSFLHSGITDFSTLSEEDFTDKVIKKASLADNFEELFRLMASDDSKYVSGDWRG